MSTFRRIMLNGRLGIDIDSLPETQKIYYTATFRVKPKADSLGVVIVNKWGSSTKEGVIACENTITTIGKSAFVSCHSLTSITIPDSVTTIGEYAFESCSNLTSITIPDSVTTIGSSAFSGCSSLTNVTIPEGVTTIGYYTFYNCSNLTSVTIPDSVTAIGSRAFYNCSNLTSVTIPDSVTTIQYDAFLACTSLTSVYCKATTPPTLGSSVFNTNLKDRKIYVPIGSVSAYRSAAKWSDYASAIVGYDFEKGEIEMNPCYEIWYTSSNGNVVNPHFLDVFGANITSNTYTDGKGVITFDGNVTTIGENAFNFCYNLTSVTIPNSVTTIGDSAFSVCDRLTEFKGKFASEDGRSLIMNNTIIAYANASGTTYTIPDSVTTIGNYVFQSCTSLTSITIPDSVTTIGDYAFRFCGSLTEFDSKYASEDGRCLIIDGTLHSFAPYGLTEYTIPNSVTTIGEWAFSECTSLTNVIIPNSVTTIGESAFEGCDSFTSITIGDGVTTIGSRAFSSCKNLTSVTIPNSVTTIGIGAFRYCTSLTSVYCRPTTPPSLGGTVAFVDNASGRKIYVPTESVDAYKSATNWSKDASAIEGYEF